MSRLLATLRMSRCDRGLEELDPDEQWNHVRGQVIKRFIGPGLIPVPKLDLATKCNVLCVFKKCKRFLRKPVFEYIGNLKDLVVKRINWNEIITKPGRTFYSRDLMPRYHQDLIVPSQPNNEYEIQINGASYVQVKDDSLESSTIVVDRKHPSLRRVKYIYVVTEVIYASNLYFKVSCEFTMLTDVALRKKTPIAFRYKKFKMAADGNLVEVCTNIRWRSNQAGWTFPYKITNISIANALHTSMRHIIY